MNQRRPDHLDSRGIARRDVIVAYMREHQEMTLQQISEHFDLSRERVGQIAKLEGYSHPNHRWKGGVPRW